MVFIIRIPARRKDTGKDHPYLPIMIVCIAVLLNINKSMFAFSQIYFKYIRKYKVLQTMVWSTFLPIIEVAIKIPPCIHGTVIFELLPVTRTRIWSVLFIYVAKELFLRRN